MSNQFMKQHQQCVFDNGIPPRFSHVSRASHFDASHASAPGTSEQSQISSWLFFSKSDDIPISSRDPIEPRAGRTPDSPLVIIIRCMAASEIAFPLQGLDRHLNWLEITLGSEWTRSHSNSKCGSWDLSLLAGELHDLRGELAISHGLSFSRVYVTGLEDAGLVAWRLFFDQPDYFRGIAMFSENRPVKILQPSLMENSWLKGRRVLLGSAFGKPVTGTLAVGRYLHALGMEVTTRLRFPDGTQFYSDLIDWVRADFTEDISLTMCDPN